MMAVPRTYEQGESVFALTISPLLSLASKLVDQAEAAS